MKFTDVEGHVRGDSRFVDDLPEPAGLLHAAVFVSPCAHGLVKELDLSAAARAEGVAGVFSADSIPGENRIGVILEDEPLLAEGTVLYAGQPLAIVAADGPERARLAAALVRADFEERPAVFDGREAAAAGLLIVPPRTLAAGDVDAAFSSCPTVASGRAESGGQEHVYLETQAALAVPLEGGRIKIHSATQSPTAVQRAAARVLRKAMADVEVEVARLGGAFGGKEDQATPWAVMAALAADRLRRPVKLVLRRYEDMHWTGKRHPYSSDFRIGLDADLRIRAFEVVYYQNAGAYADLSPAILERSLFHALNSYSVPNVRITGYSCRTNLPPFTAFRGFGAPQAVFVMEAAVLRAAEAAGVEPEEIRRRNLLAEGDVLPFGMRVAGCRAGRCFREAAERFEWEKKRKEAAAFNARHRHLKKGLSLVPICFGISFTKTFLNQAGALVHIYTDGSVSVSTGAVEMGQGVNAKIRRIAARTLGIREERVSVESANTRRVANTSPTAASTGADLNGMAARLACLELRGRLRRAAAALLEVEEERLVLEEEVMRVEDGSASIAWEDLVQKAYLGRLNLSAQAFYATPRIHYDARRERGRPFAYHVFGAGLTEVTLDCLRGTFRVDAVRVVHDAGRSLDPLIDRGQVEGAVVQGLGWMTLEELVYDEKGRLLTDSLGTYKIPDLDSAPGEIEVVFLSDADNPEAVMQSKGIGEPPLLYGIGVYPAVLQAAAAFRPDRPLLFDAPLTNEKTLRMICGGAFPGEDAEEGRFEGGGKGPGKKGREGKAVSETFPPESKADETP